MWPRPYYYGGYHSHGHSDPCYKYSGADRTACLQHYASSCDIIVNGTTTQTAKCTGTAVGSSASSPTRDDFMGTGFDMSTASYPLTVTIYRVAATVPSAQAFEEWDPPIWFGFSQVAQTSDEEWPSWAVALLVIGIVALCVGFCICGYLCVKGRNDNNYQQYGAAPPKEDYQPSGPSTVVGLPMEYMSSWTSQPTVAYPWQSVQEVDAQTGASTGRIYYHNTETNETSWNPPGKVDKEQPAHTASSNGQPASSRSRCC